MDRRRTIALGALLLAAGVLLGWFFGPGLLRRARDLAPPTAEDVRRDAVRLAAVVAPGSPFEEDLPPEFLAWWDARRVRYSPDQLADLRSRLEDYLDFLQAEHADWAEHYRQGPGFPPAQRSDAARALREKLPLAFGEEAATMIRQADAEREKAFEASPKTAGFDPALTDYTALWEEFLRWLPLAKARVVRLTDPAPR